MTGQSGGSPARQMAMVTGASGQDRYLLARRLLDEGALVDTLVRDPARLDALPRDHGCVGVDQACFRPMEVAELLGNASKAREAGVEVDLASPGGVE